MRVIFLILIGLSSVINAGNFSRNSGIVSDNAANLEWQDDYSDNNNSIKQTTWQSAIDYCEALTLDAKSDWRLPNLNELISLVDDTKFNPSINMVFQNTNSKYYWSSTSLSYLHDGSWIIRFYSGGQRYDIKNANNYVRCVRVGQ